MNKVQIRKFRSVALPNSTLNSILCYIYPNTKCLRMGRGIGREKMPVAAANLPNERN